MNYEKNEKNIKLFNAAAYIASAAKIIAEIDINFSSQLFDVADKILSIIDPEKDKLNKQQIKEILEEIFAAEE